MCSKTWVGWVGFWVFHGLPISVGLMLIWQNSQKCLGSQATWWNIKIQVNPTQGSDESPCVQRSIFPSSVRHNETISMFCRTEPQIATCGQAATTLWDLTMQAPIKEYKARSV